MPQDYIMRLLQQIAMMLGAIVTKRRGGEIEEAKKDVEAGCLQTVGIPLEVVKRWTPEILAEHLRASGGNRYHRSVMLAELLLQDAEMCEERGEMPEALVSYLHAFCLLFDSVDVLSAEEQGVYRAKLAVLATKLECFPPNAYVAEKLRAYRLANDG